MTKPHLFSKDSSVREHLSEVEWCTISQLELLRVLLLCFADFYMGGPVPGGGWACLRTGVPAHLVPGRLRHSRWSRQVQRKPLGGAEFLLRCTGGPGLQWVRHFSVGHGPVWLHLRLCPWALVLTPPTSASCVSGSVFRSPPLLLEALCLDLAGLLSIGLPKGVT